MGKYYKHPEYKHVYGEMLPTPVVRCCWPSLVKPKDPPPPKEGMSPGTPRFEVTVLLPKDSAEVKTFISQLETMVAEMLTEFNDKRPAKLAGPLTLCQDGDTFDMEKYPYYKGQWVMVARNAKRPEVRNALADLSEPETIIGGVKVRLAITPLITAHGCSYKLECVQFIEDDKTRFGGGTRDLGAFMSAINPAGPGSVGDSAKVQAEPEQAASAPEQTKVSAEGKKAAFNLL